MIKIINGVFGFNDGTGVTPKTPKDEPFVAPAEVEARLVKQGVAIYVDEVENALEENQEVKDFLEGNTDNVPEGTTEITDAEAEKELLVKQAKELGITGHVAGMKVETLKNKIAEALANKQEAEGEANAVVENATVEGEENAPDLGNDDGVVG